MRTFLLFLACCALVLELASPQKLQVASGLLKSISSDTLKKLLKDTTKDIKTPGGSFKDGANSGTFVTGGNPLNITDPTSGVIDTKCANPRRKTICIDWVRRRNGRPFCKRTRTIKTC